MTEIEETLSLAPHCLLAVIGAGGPVVGAAPFWWDGAGVWALGAGVPEVVAELGDGASATVLVAADGPEGPTVRLAGRARVHGAGDPLALALRAPAVTAALSALALKLGPDLAGYARDLPRVPTSRWPAGLALIRVLADDIDVVPAPPSPAGMSPAVPSVVPPAVRRALSGRREVVVATAESGAPRLVTASWSGDLRLLATEPLPDGAAVAVVVADGRVGLALEGTVSGQRLRPTRARWWQGLVTGEAEVSAGLRLPD